MSFQIKISRISYINIHTTDLFIYTELTGLLQWVKIRKRVFSGKRLYIGSWGMGVGGFGKRGIFLGDTPAERDIFLYF
jgi:hypothetical protein